jgi:hypothetical protein
MPIHRPSRRLTIPHAPRLRGAIALIAGVLAATCAAAQPLQTSVERGKPRLTYAQPTVRLVNGQQEATLQVTNAIATFRQLQLTGPLGTQTQTLAPGQTQTIRVVLRPGQRLLLAESYDLETYRQDLKAARDALPPEAWKDLLSIGGHVLVEAIFEPATAQRIIGVGQVLLSISEVQPLIERGEYLRAAMAVVSAIQASQKLQADVAEQAGGPWAKVVMALIRYREPLGRFVAATMMLAMDAVEGPGITRYVLAGEAPRRVATPRAAPTEIMPLPGPTSGVISGPVGTPTVIGPKDGATVGRKLIVAGRAAPGSLVVVLLDAHDPDTGEFISTIPGTRRVAEEDGTFRGAAAVPLLWSDRRSPVLYKMRVYALSQTARSKPAVVTLHASP